MIITLINKIRNKKKTRFTRKKEESATHVLEVKYIHRVIYIHSVLCLYDMCFLFYSYSYYFFFSNTKILKSRTADI